MEKIAESIPGKKKTPDKKYKWMCKICGAVDIGEHPPIFCSICKAPASQRIQEAL